MNAPQPPVVRTLRLGGLGITVELPPSIRRFRRRPAAQPAIAALPPIELPDERPTFEATKQSPDKWLDLWRAPEEFWEQAGDEPAAKVEPETLADKVKALPWYHTIELPGGVVTPGLFDHRTLLPHYGFPASLAGKRALDVATFDGFWAFQLERLGAEVTAVDLPAISGVDFAPGMREMFVSEGLDRDPSEAFYVASEALGSKIDLRKSTVYDISPEVVGGQFDFVHLGDLLLHLRDPMKALERVRSVTKDGGTFHLADAYEPALGSGPAMLYQGGWNFCTWWVPSLDALTQMVLDAGFSSVRLHRTFRANTADGPGWWRAILIATA